MGLHPLSSNLLPDKWDLCEGYGGPNIGEKRFQLFQLLQYRYSIDSITCHCWIQRVQTQHELVPQDIPLPFLSVVRMTSFQPSLLSLIDLQTASSAQTPKSALQFCTLRLQDVISQASIDRRVRLVRCWENSVSKQHQTFMFLASEKSKLLLFNLTTANALLSLRIGFRHL